MKITIIKEVEIFTSLFLSCFTHLIHVIIISFLRFGTFLLSIKCGLDMCFLRSDERERKFCIKYGENLVFAVGDIKTLKFL